MKYTLSLLACVLGLNACAEPVTNSRRTITLDGNKLEISSGTWSEGYFLSVDKLELGWSGKFEGGKEKWNARRDALEAQMRAELVSMCGTPFVAVHRGPMYRMLDNDETMGGMTAALGVTAAMIGYLAAEAATKEENIPTGVFVEFDCPVNRR